MDLKNLTELELYFSDHFDTAIFPVLAEIYQRKADYVRAKKVCEIGLKNHPHSADGHFILSQAEMGLGNLSTAEKLLKKVLDKYPNHLAAAAALPLLQEQLGRSQNTLKESWRIAQEADPTNEFANEFLSPKNSKKNKKPKPISTEIMLEKASISPRLATFTLVHVLKGQALYDRALEVLNILEEKGESKKQISAERKIIKSLL